jgi:hypothetical protein
MNREDILRMAREAGCVDPMVFFGAYERFAGLVAAAERKNYEHTLALQQKSYEREIQIEVEAEREACAKVCDVRCVEDGWEGGYADECAAEIRARSKS